MFGCVNSRLFPRIAVKMSNHPNIAHFVSGCSHLLMRVHWCYAKAALVADLIAIISVKADAEALRLFKFIIVNLGLRMIMRRIARPTARLVENLAQYKVLIRSVFMVKHRKHLSVSRAVPLVCAKVLNGHILAFIIMNAEIV